MQDESDLAFQNLNGIADLEAKLAFLESENQELKAQKEISLQSQSVEISRLNEHINEMNESMQDARIATNKLAIFEKKMEDMEVLILKNQKQEQELDELRAENEMFQSAQQKIQKMERAVNFYKNEAFEAKKQAGILKLELDKQVNEVQLRQREIEDSHRIN